jgi:hypothetical protein
VIKKEEWGMKKKVMKQVGMWGMVLVLVGCLAGMAQAGALNLSYAEWGGNIRIFDRAGNLYTAVMIVDIPAVRTGGITGFAGRFGFGTVRIIGTNFVYDETCDAAAQQTSVVPGAAVTITWTAPASAIAPFDGAAAFGLSLSATLTTAAGTQNPILQGNLTRAGRFNSAFRLSPVI